MIDATFLKEAERLAKEGLRATVLPLPLEKPGVYAIVAPDGKVDIRTAGPSWHHEKIETPKDLQEFIENTAAPGGAIYISEQEAVFVFSQADRRDRATCVLEKSEPYALLVKLDAVRGDMLTHEELVRHLRITFRSCFPKEILDLLRSVKFTSGAESTAVVKNQGGESMGSAIRAATAGQQQIPDEIFFRVPVLSNHVFAADIACALEVFPAAQKFRITPYPGEVQKAMAGTLDDIAGLFAEDGPPVFRGTVL